MSTNLQVHKLKDKQHLDLKSPIVRISSCRQYFAAGCLDQSIRIWPTVIDYFKTKPFFQHNEMVSSISDVSFNPKSTHVATVSIDSNIKIWDLDSHKQNTQNYIAIQSPLLSAVRLLFTNHYLITAGDVGRICYYDIFSKEIVKKFQIGNQMLSAITYSEALNKLIVGNTNGDMFLFGAQKKQDLVNIKPHNKQIRSINFFNKTQKLLSASDDYSVAVTDISTLKISNRFQGHSESVNCAKQHPIQKSLVVSCSSDKTIKIWDIRTEKSILTHTTNGGLWDMDIIDSYIVTGGQLGILHILSLY